jgi:hypothetical protein
MARHISRMPLSSAVDGFATCVSGMTCVQRVRDGTSPAHAMVTCAHIVQGSPARGKSEYPPAPPVPPSCPASAAPTAADFSAGT